MDFGGEAGTGALLTLAAGGVLAGIRMLVGSKVKQIDGLPQQLQQLQIELVAIKARLERAEADIANDKAGRRAFAAVEVLVGKISADIGHLSADLAKLSARHEKGNDELWSAVNRLRENRDAA